MAGEAIFTGVVGDVVSRVISLIIGHFTHHQTTESKLQSISYMLIRIHSVVEEAKVRQITNHGTLQWLSELIDGEYEGRYLLDSIRCEEHELEGEHGDDLVPQVSTVSLYNPAKRVRVSGCTMRRLLSRYPDLSVDEIDRVLERLQGVCDNLKEFIMLLQGCLPICRPLATNIFRDGQMFGRHVEKERIINFLLHDGGSWAGELVVLPIVGEIGVGKTTLVQHACDDARVRSHFPVMMLCCTYATSTDGGTGVLQSKLVIGDAGMISPNDPLQLCKGDFGNKRLLMVFENVDMHKRQLLEELLPSLRCAKGSKIIVTTNNRRVTTIGTVEPIILKVLPFPEYWFFFKAHAFAGTDIEENPRLVTAGKAIARKLNGSFFGAKIVGEVLRDHLDPKFWCNVLSNIGGLSLMGGDISYISDLADNLLPGHVDMCKVTISKSLVASRPKELTRLQDLCSVAPHGSAITCWADDVRFAEVLVCKSVFPFHICYYTARCICTCNISLGLVRFRAAGWCGAGGPTALPPPAVRRPHRTAPQVLKRTDS